MSERLITELLSEASCWREDRVWHLDRARSAPLRHPATPRLLYEATERAVEAARLANHRLVELKRLVRSLEHDPDSFNLGRSRQ